MDTNVTIDKIVEQSKKWTLEGDCTLLQLMNQISNNLEERVTKTSSAINEMSVKLDRTSVALSNATNNLAALQYSKYVENRVHDDDETLSNRPSPSSEDVTDKKDSNQDISSFLKKNLEKMNSCHEAYSISYQDSDDDDDDEPVTNVVYRSKNPYEARPLPHIYGSNLWKEKWHIGLCDSDNDFSGDENSEQFSESTSSAEDSYESTAPTMSEWDSTAWGLNTQHNVERKDLRTPSNDGESSYQGEDYSQSKVSTPTTQRSISIAQQPIQDQRYYHHVPRRQENLFDDIFTDSKPPQVAPPQVVTPQAISVPQNKPIPESYIPNEPPPDDQSVDSDNRRAGAKKTLNLFDDDEFSSFMDQIVQKATNKNANPNEKFQRNAEPTKPTVVSNLFNDQAPSEINFQKQPKNESNLPNPKPPSKPVAPNLFEDSEDLFSRTSEKTEIPPKKTIPPNLFNDTDDLFTPPPPLPVVKQKSASPKIEDDIFSPSPPTVSSIVGKTKIRNLFDDDEDDGDDFDNIFAPKPSTSRSFSQATKNLFAHDDDVGTEDKDLNLEKESIRNVATASEELITANESRQTPATRSLFTEKESPLENSVLKTSTSLIKKGLFDDFDDLEDEDDLFSSKPAKKDIFEDLFKKEKPDNKFSVLQKNTSLFGDEDEEETMEKAQLDEEYVEDKPKLDDSRNIPNISNTADVPKKEPEDSIAVSGLSSNKTEFENIFADDADSTNSSKSIDEPVTHSVPNELSYSEPNVPSPSESTESLSAEPIESAPKIPEPFVKPLAGAKPAVLKTKPKLPVIARKPLVDKTSKPQNPIVPQSTKKEEDTDTVSNVEPFKASQPSDKDISEVKPPESIKNSSIKESLENVKPTLKAKPNITIEDDKISSPSKDHLDGNLLSTKKPVVIPSYTSLFHDDLPPEDEHPNSASNEESPMHTVDDDVEANPAPSSSTSSVPYNSLNLFTDVPPDDYFPVITQPPPPAAAADTKRIHSIFYDDFHETIEAGREMRTLSNYMITDEPPPDDKPIVSETKPEKPKVSKLKKMDFQINVGALLPSAKMPSFKKTDAVNKSGNETVVKEEVKQSVKPDPVPNKPASDQTRESPDNILQNLNRDRAKVQVKRRPSTRTGRQERYRISMIEESNSVAEVNDNDMEQDSTDGSNDQNKENTQNRTSLFEDFRTNQNSKEVLNQLPDQATLFKESDSFFTKTVTTTSSTSVKATTKKLPSLFQDSDSEADNIFETMKSNTNKPEPTQSTATTKNLDSLFNSDGIDENPFGTPKNFFPQSTVIAKESPKIVEEKEKSKPEAEVVKSVNETVKSTLKSSSLFGDSDDGSDDLFKEVKVAKATIPKKSSKPKSAASKPAKPSTSLFSSDEGSGSGDDIFGKAKPKVTTKKVEVVKNKPASSLFNDLSDDDSDGLFGASTKKSAQVNKSKTNPPTSRAPPPTKQPAQAQPAKATSSNPLSDLLGP